MIQLKPVVALGWFITGWLLFALADTISGQQAAPVPTQPAPNGGPTKSKLPEVQMVMRDLVDPRALAAQPGSNRIAVADAGKGKIWELHGDKSRELIQGFATTAVDAPSVPGSLDALLFVTKELLLVGTTNDQGRPELRLYRWPGTAEATAQSAGDWLGKATVAGFEAKPTKESNAAGTTQPPSEATTQPPSEATTQSAEVGASPAVATPPTDPTAAPASATESGSATVELVGAIRSLVLVGSEIYFLSRDAAGQDLLCQSTLNGEALSKLVPVKFAGSETPGIPTGLVNGRLHHVVPTPEKFLMLVGQPADAPTLGLHFFDLKKKSLSQFVGPLATAQQFSFSPKRGRLLVTGTRTESPAPTTELFKLVVDANNPMFFCLFPVMKLQDPRGGVFDAQGNFYIAQRLVETGDANTGGNTFVVAKITNLEVPYRADQTGAAPASIPATNAPAELRPGMTIIE